MLRVGLAFRTTRAVGLHRKGVPTAVVLAIGLLLIVLAPMLEAGDASALADFTAVHATVSKMAVVPFARDTPTAFAISAAVPMLPVALVSTSVDQLLGKLLSIIA